MNDVSFTICFVSDIVCAGVFLYLQTGLVPNFPTLIVSGFIALSALISFFSGLILSEIVEKERREYEFRLQMIEMSKKRIVK